MIRAATVADVGAVRDVVQAAYSPYIARIGQPPGPMLDDYARRIADGQVWVLDHSGRVIGVLVLEARDDALLLDNVALLPEWQGRGHGRTLLAFAEAEARRFGWREIRLYTHVLMTENQALYARCGFVATARVREKGFDRVYMAKPLA